MNRLDRWLRRLLAGYGRQDDRTRRRPVPATPTGAAARRPDVRILTWVLAIGLPLAVAAAFVPIREDHATVAAVSLVAVVVLVALSGATVPAVIAALLASGSFAVLLTEPYSRFEIANAEDVVASVVLLGVGSTVAVIQSRLLTLARIDERRVSELSVLAGFADIAVGEHGEVLAGATADHLCRALGARGCRWREGYTGTAAPTMSPTGAFEGRPSRIHPDAGPLPPTFEIPVAAGGRELGRFVVDADPSRVVSAEERRTALAIVTLFAGAWAAAPDHGSSPSGDR